MNWATKTLITISMSGLLATASMAQDLTPAEQLDARTKVETGVALAEIAEAEKDGEALLAAARLLSGVGSVSKRDTNGGDPEFYSVGDMVEMAKSLGVDAARADEVGASASAERSYCYWDYECGTFECGWLYICQ